MCDQKSTATHFCRDTLNVHVSFSLGDKSSQMNGTQKKAALFFSKPVVFNEPVVFDEPVVFSESVAFHGV